MSTQAIGIDFGTTKTLVAYLNPREKRPETLRLGRGSDFVPTTAAIDAEGRLFFGDEAEDMLEDPSVAYLRGFKMELGSETPLYMLAQADGSVKPVTAQQLATEFLRRLRLEVQEKVFMGDAVAEAVITRPVQFSPARCRALKEAALAAGFTKVALTTEPEAAGLAFCCLNTAEAFKGNALVIDWGGGTLDIALVSRQGDRIVRHGELMDGDTDIGGERFDERLWKHAEAQLEGACLNPVTQLPRVRKAKEQLSSRSSVTLRLSAEGGTCPPLELTRELFESLIAADVDKAARMVQALLSRIPAEMKPEMLLLVGGSSAIPLIREKLEAATGLPARSWQYSREAVALGSALMTGVGRAEAPAPNAAQASGSNLALDQALLNASENGDLRAVCRLLDEGAEVNAKDEIGRTPLYAAAENGHTDVVHLLLAAGANISTVLGGGWSELHLAASTGLTVRVRKLLEAGADVNAKDEYGYTPLHLAAESGHTDVVRLLLEAGADVQTALSDGWSELHFAASTGLTDRVRKLLETGADINAKDWRDYTPLHWAVAHGHTDSVRLLLEAGADVNAKDRSGYTPLHVAVENGHMDAARLLLEAGADLQTALSGGRSELHIAASTGLTDKVRKLLEAGADVNAKDRSGYTPLHLAVENGHTDSVRLLLEAGADVNAKTEIGYTPLHLAVENGHMDAVNLLLAAGAELQTAQTHGWSELHIAASTGLADRVRKLLEAGADVNAKTESGWTPLHVAAENGYTDVVRLLLEAGADVNGTSRWKPTPLDLAIEGSQPECMGVLREFGGKLSWRASFRRLSLMKCLMVLLAGVALYVVAGQLLMSYAIEHEMTPTARFFRFSVSNEWKNDRLRSAVRVGNWGEVRPLLAAGANVNTKDKYGNTPLHAAAFWGHADTARLLLEAGADVNAKNESGNTPLRAASFWGHADVALLLKNYGAKE